MKAEFEVTLRLIAPNAEVMPLVQGVYCIHLDGEIIQILTHAQRPIMQVKVTPHSKDGQSGELTLWIPLGVPHA